MRSFLMIIAAVMVMAIGASANEAEMDHYEKEYISGCMKFTDEDQDKEITTTPKELNEQMDSRGSFCVCQWQGIEEKMTVDELRKANDTEDYEIPEWKKFIEIIKSRSTFCSR